MLDGCLGLIWRSAVAGAVVIMTTQGNFKTTGQKHNNKHMRLRVIDKGHGTVNRLRLQTS